MRLVYNHDLSEVTVGQDITLANGRIYKITEIKPPFSPSATGRVVMAAQDNPNELPITLYPNVIRATWIEREDRLVTNANMRQDERDFYQLTTVKGVHKNTLVATYPHPVQEDTSPQELIRISREWFTTYWCVLNNVNPTFVG